MLLYTPIKVFSVVLGFLAAGSVIGFVVIRIGDSFNVDTTLTIGYSALAGLFIGSLQPTLLYLLGEWIGRSLIQTYQAIVVSVVAVITAFPFAYLLYACYVYFRSNGEIDVMTIIGVLFPISESVPYGKVIFVTGVVFANYVPLFVGTLSGAMRRRLLNLEFVCKKSGEKQRTEVAQRLDAMIAEYQVPAT